ncbi:cobalt-precorrin-5B (C(1))-methyltransferase CbiD [Maribellus maritimus]|uniref:cobalt-precorrin-5B (C(1))-methyltransferase CbiD n=1 Tax=Maribellus maritimus TaxID=2870838 RepID=UPI001EEC5E72|nr:cobalt-precorrin-5B (C(1))-methyltransferase CbiD [Maribellus maritimus]MCG6190281.1 cobalt-precorrin-5B (C(1))-methyltransferase CbiD [Maribellus maritimus]
MVLVFGGTTEGKKTAEILDFIEEPYFYSTKTDVHSEWKGKSISGEMDVMKIVEFSLQNKIRLLIDAAHPFALQLHRNIYEAAKQLDVPILRYEREYEELQKIKNVTFFDSYEHLSIEILKSNFQRILSLTGVQTILLLKKIWENRTCFFRILDTELSLQKAAQTGIPEEWIIPMTPSDNADELLQLAKRTGAEILLSKESGASGFMDSKIVVANQLNIPLWIVKRPALPNFDFTVYSEKQLLQQIYVLRKSVLKKEGELRSGFTTGTCVTAAVKACFMALAEGAFPKSVEVFLPDGEQTSFLVFPESLSEKSATCTVIKNGGDDPDVTHGKEIGCELILSEQQGIRFLQGKGVGKVTLPGLQLPVGEPAINPVPRKMITEALETLADEYDMDAGFDVKPFVPEGEELAKQTFNPRVGVVGGVSIIGTTGKVKPYSNEAFLATIKYQLSVAYKLGLDEVVFTSGKRSENQLRSEFPHLPDTAFIHFGNLVGDSIKLAVQQNIKKINLALMFGKAIKLAGGNLDTHSKNVRFNPTFLAGIARDCGYQDNVILQIENLQIANAIFSILPIGENKSFYKKIAKKCFGVCNSALPQGYLLGFILLLSGENNIEVNSFCKKT